MRRILLLIMLIFFMFVMAQKISAQANRNGKGKQIVTVAHWDETGALICCCNEKITSSVYIGNYEYQYKECPNPDCRSVWFAKIKDGKLSKPYQKYENKPKQKHSCKKDVCLRIISEAVDKDKKRIVIKRIGECKETIYIAFIGIGIRILSSTMSEDELYVNKDVSINCEFTNDKKAFFERYGVKK